LQGFERAEAALGVQHGRLVSEVEQSFIAARRSARENNAKAFDLQLTALTSQLSASEDALVQATNLSASGEFVASLVIILREGIDAFLIIGALLSLLTKTGAAKQKKRVH